MEQYLPLEKDRYGLIDGDIILYACAFVAEKENRDEKGAIACIDDMLLNMRDTLQLSDGVVFLSDDSANNFRTEIAVTHPYKAGRKEEKPQHFHFLRDYLLDEWAAKIVKGAEADDGMGKAQKKNTIICSIDKDMDMIPGWHFNWKRFKIYKVSTEEAQRHFWTQMLTGDRTDNIFAITGIGPKKAEKLLADCANEFLMYSTVVQQYAQEFGGHARDRFYENYDLLKIQGAPVHFRDEPLFETKKNGVGLA